MVRVDELSSKIKNYSNTPFWTMTSNGDNVRYALKNADDLTTIYVDFIPEKALECEIYINFFKEFINGGIKTAINS